jgi:hypothetical protein
MFYRALLVFQPFSCFASHAWSSQKPRVALTKFVTSGFSLALALCWGYNSEVSLRRGPIEINNCSFV